MPHLIVNRAYLRHSYRKHERAKIRAYEERVREIEHSSFTPLVMSLLEDWGMPPKYASDAYPQCSAKSWTFHTAQHLLGWDVHSPSPSSDFQFSLFEEPIHPMDAPKDSASYHVTWLSLRPASQYLWIKITFPSLIFNLLKLNNFHCFLYFLSFSLYPVLEPLCTVLYIITPQEVLYIECGTVVRTLQKCTFTVEISANNLTTHIKLKRFHSSFQFWW